MKSIELKHLWKEYGDNVVLENISLTVQAGELSRLLVHQAVAKRLS